MIISKSFISSAGKQFMFAALNMKAAFQYSVPAFIAWIIAIGISGCANIIPPGGGPRDSLPPMLVSSTPPDSSKNIRPNRISLTFNEYVEPIQNVQDIIISPTIAAPADIQSKLRTVTIRFKDTLEPNTTYSINFGKGIKDVNEGNVLEDFTYIFSTGSSIDQNILTGKVVMAETGRVDSTLIAILHSNLSDTAILTQRPRYYTTVDGNGNFVFYHLPAGKFNVYVLERESFLKQYTDSTMKFGFLDSTVVASANPAPVMVYAYQQAKLRSTAPTTNPNTGRNQDKRLRYSNPEGNSKDVLSPLRLDFVRKLKSFDSAKFILTDTGYKKLNAYSVTLDSNLTRITIAHPWKMGTGYKLIILKDAVSDNDGVTLAKNDTLSFTTKKSEEYGSVKIRFKNLDISLNPVLQLVQNDAVIESVAITGKEWKSDIVKPGEYELRILFDTNKNLSWDPGNYRLKKQPEIVHSFPVKLNVRSNWDNEIEISL